MKRFTRRREDHGSKNRCIERLTSQVDIFDSRNRSRATDGSIGSTNPSLAASSRVAPSSRGALRARPATAPPGARRSAPRSCRKSRPSLREAARASGAFDLRQRRFAEPGWCRSSVFLRGLEHRRADRSCATPATIPPGIAAVKSSACTASPWAARPPGRESGRASGSSRPRPRRRRSKRSFAVVCEHAGHLEIGRQPAWKLGPVKQAAADLDDGQVSLGSCGDPPASGRLPVSGATLGSLRKRSAASVKQRKRTAGRGGDLAPCFLPG